MKEHAARHTVPAMTSYKTVSEAIRAKLAAETVLREKRSLDEWILAERKCVMHEIDHQRRLLACFVEYAHLWGEA